MNELTTWLPFNTETNASGAFNQFIDLIQNLDNNTSPDLWFKWKNHAQQVVIETPNYYYKLYQNLYSSGEFLAQIREAIGKVYREQYGILWNTKHIIQDGFIYTIEQREKLQVCNPDIISYDDMFLGWSETLKLIEKELIFPEISIQLRNKIKDLHEIKLVRECINKYIDYAITKDNKIVLLDDADWFIALTDKDGDWINASFNTYDILTLLGEKTFAPSNYFDIKDRLDSVNKQVNHWMIFSKQTDSTKNLNNLKSKTEQMLTDNIKMLTTGKLLSNNRKLYVDETQLYPIAHNQSPIKSLSHRQHSSESK